MSKPYRIPIKRADGTWDVVDEVCATDDEAYSLMEARERARLSVLDLTPKDKAFLRSLKVKV